MITGNPQRLKAAQELLLRFITIGRVPDQKRRDELQRSPAGWPISRDALAGEIKDRLDGNLPHQRETSYCGPAAFLYCLIHDRPDVYVMYAISLWERGRFSFGTKDHTVRLNSGHGVIGAAAELVKTRTSDPGHRHINDIDWMTMSCLSQSTRPIGIGTVAPDDDLGSITYPNVMRSWFAAAGSMLRTDTMGLGVMKSALLDMLSLMKQWGSSWIVLQIDSSLLSGGSTNTFQQRHWVVVDPHHPPRARKGTGGPWIPLGEAAGEIWAELMRQTSSGRDLSEQSQQRAATALSGRHLAGWETDLRVASWANEQHGIFGGKLGQAFDRIYGGYAFSRFR